MNVQAQLWQAEATYRGYGEAAASHNKSLSMHRWANWIAGFSAEFAHSAIKRFLSRPNHSQTVMDPFAGVGTTLVEANRLGLDNIGFEINPFAALVCRVKLGAAEISLPSLQDSINGYKSFMQNPAGLEPFSSPPAGFRSRIPFFSPAVERKVLFTLDYMDTLPPPIKDIFRVAFASVMVDFSNYSYEPSLGTRPAAGKVLVQDADVGKTVAGKLRDMAADIAELQAEAASGTASPSRRFFEQSFFDAETHIGTESVDLVVTSPPYMNNYHYVRNSRPQLFWSGLVESPSELKRLETGNFGKFWQTVRGDAAIPLVPQLPLLEDQIGEIRDMNNERGVYGGGGWANYVTAYMNDLDRLCELLAKVLKPGGKAVVVVGNSIVQGREIKVEERLCEIAELNGLSLVDVTKLRERVGSSIINSGARQRSNSKSRLYDAAVVIHRPS